MRIQIRSLRPEELDFLKEMLAEAVALPAGAPQCLAWTVMEHPDLARYYEGWGRAGDVALAAEDMECGWLVGCAWGRLFTAERRGEGFVDERTPEITIAVAPERRNQGIGGELMEALAREYQAQGVERLSLNVAPGNPARRLYARCGFEPHRQGAQGCVMVRKLQIAECGLHNCGLRIADCGLSRCGMRSGE